MTPRGCDRARQFSQRTGRTGRRLQDILLADMEINAVVVEMPLLNQHSPGTL